MQTGPWLSPCPRAAAASGCSSLSFWVHKPGPESWDTQNVLCGIRGRGSLCPSRSCPPAQVRPCLRSPFGPAVPRSGCWTLRDVPCWEHSLPRAWHRGLFTACL